MNSVDFSLWLELMSALPASAPQWYQAHKFIADATDIIKLKEVENAQATEFTTLLDDIRECFSGELVYLGRNVDSVGLGFTFFSEALRVARELEALLHNFRSVRARQPESFDEEEQLSSERIEAGGRVRETIDRLNELLSIPDMPLTETEPEETLDTHRSHEVEDRGQDGIGPSGELTDSGPESLIEQDIAHSERNDLFSLDERESSEGLVEAISGIEITDDDKDQDVLPIKPKRRYGIELPVESATRYIESSSLYDLETLMWSLIADDDLSGAYWISTYLDAEGYESPATPMLLKAVQGARWLSSDVDRFAGELFEIVADYVRSERSSSQDLLEFAASVHSTAVASHSQMLDWLKTPDCCPELERIVRQIRELPSKGISLRPEYVRGLGETVSQNEGIASASEDVRKWMEEAPMKRTKYGRANSVWKHLTDDGGGLSKMLGPVKDDVRNDVSKVREGLSGWNPDSSLEIINSTANWRRARFPNHPLQEMPETGCSGGSRMLGRKLTDGVD